MRLKRWISGLCAAVLCLGGSGNAYGDMPPIGLFVYTDEVEQPTGETFIVETDDVLQTIQVGESCRAKSKESKNYYYMVYLNKDGYWYYLEYSEVIFSVPNDPDSKVTVTSAEEFERMANRPGYSIEYRMKLTTKFMIDPLPSKVFKDGGSNPLAMRETSQDEKDAMAAAIEAEQERLMENVTSVISDPGPEMFIYEPVETETTEESPASATEQPQTSVAAETAASASVPSQPAETTADTSAAAPAIAEPPEDTGGEIIWIILLCGGGIIIIAGVIAVFLLQRRKKRAQQ